MARLQIKLVSGEVSDHRITPSIEYAFEIWAKKGFSKAFAEDSKQEHIFYLAWECLKRSGTMNPIPTFGAGFIDLLDEVKVLDDLPNA
jgi:hypothetical protein